MKIVNRIGMTLVAALFALLPPVEAATCKNGKRADGAGRCKAIPAKKPAAKTKAKTGKKANEGKKAKAAQISPEKGALYVFIDSRGCRILAAESSVRRMQEIAVGGSVTWDGKCADGLISGTGVLRQEGVFIEGGRSKHFAYYYSGRAKNGVRLGQWTRETLDRFDDSTRSWTSLARLEFVNGVPKSPPKPIPVRGANQHSKTFTTRVLDPEAKRAQAAAETLPPSASADAVSLKAAAAVATVAPPVAPAPTPAPAVLATAAKPAVPLPVPTPVPPAPPTPPKPAVSATVATPSPTLIPAPPKTTTVAPTPPAVAPAPTVASRPDTAPTTNAPPRVNVSLSAAPAAVAPAPTPASAAVTKTPSPAPTPPAPVPPASPVPPKPAVPAAVAATTPAPANAPAKATPAIPAPPTVAPQAAAAPVAVAPLRVTGSLAMATPSVAPAPTPAPASTLKTLRPPAPPPPAAASAVAPTKATLVTPAPQPASIKLTSAMPAAMEKQAFGFGTGCYMDTLDGQLWESAVLTVKDRKSLRIDGWAVDDEEKTLAEASYLRLEGSDGRRYYAPTTVQERPDVAKHFGAPSFVRAGYRVVVSAENLPPGEYEATIVMNSKGRNVLCGNGRRLKL